MSLITKNNYEAYLLDYVEENLSPELIAELMLFFENNPELKEDLEAFEIHELIAPSIELVDKSQLKKEVNFITVSNYEDFIIAEVEGLNTPETSIQLNAFLAKNPSLQKDFVAYQNTKLLAPTIVFEDKKALFQKEAKVISLYWWSSAVAAAIVILVWFNGFNSSVKQQYFPLANTNHTNIDDENEDSLSFYVFEDEKPQIATVSKKITKNNKQEKNKEKGIKPSTEIVNEAEENPLAALPENKDVLDSVGQKEATPEENEIEPDEVLLAENSVKIVYEDELLYNGNPAPVKKKMTKLQIFRKVIKKQIQAKVLDKGKDRMLLAYNSKPANFIRGKNKK
ncbi:MAG: hypothetical protein ACPGSL_04605 [Vicingaceae bacterium]